MLITNTILLCTTIVSSLLIDDEIILRGEYVDPVEDLVITDGGILSLVDSETNFLKSITVEPESQLFYTTTFANTHTSRFNTLINHGFVNFQIFGNNSQDDSSIIEVAGTIHNMNQFYINGISYNMTIESLVNSGSIEFSGSSSTVKIIERVQNSGTICLSKVTPDFPDIFGTGCIIVEDVNFEFQGQEVQSTIVQNEGRFIARNIIQNTTFTFANFGNNSSVEIGNSREFKSSSYDSKTGMFTVYFSNYNVILNIGSGYVEKNFEVSELIGIVVRYNGVAPKGANPIPQDCSCPKSTLAPGTKPTLFRSTYTSKGQPVTDTILITKNNNEWITTTLGKVEITTTIPTGIIETGYTNTTKTILTTETISDEFTTTVTFNNTTTFTESVIPSDTSKPLLDISPKTSTVWHYSTLQPDPSPNTEKNTGERKSLSNKLQVSGFIIVVPFLVSVLLL